MPGESLRFVLAAEVDHVRLAIPLNKGQLPQIWLVYPPELAEIVLQIAQEMDKAKQFPSAYVLPNHAGVLFKLMTSERSILRNLFTDDFLAAIEVLPGNVELMTSGEQDFNPEKLKPFHRALRKSEGIVEVLLAAGDWKEFQPIWKTTLLEVGDQLPGFF